MGDIIYQFETPPEQRVRIGFIGCGGHSYRNLYPTFQYAPVEPVATCDLNPARAAEYARQFGFARSYSEPEAMYAAEDLDAVFIVTNYDEAGHPRHAALGMAAMRAGCHVFCEKPPAASSAEIRAWREVAEETGKFALVGFKKMFFPTIEKAASLIGSEAFGPLTSLTLKYPMTLPAATDDDRAMVGFLDHIVHPGSILHYLGGPLEELVWFRSRLNGAVVATLRFASGAVGSLHLSGGQSNTGPLERLEAIGTGSHLVLDNGVDLTWYRRGGRGKYGRSDSFLAPDDQAPLHWTPEFSLGQLYNKQIFLLGYVNEVRYFCDCVRTGAPPTKAGLDDALALLELYEAFRQPEGTTIRFG